MGWRLADSGIQQRHPEYANIAAGEVVTWRHTRFAPNCMASVTPKPELSPEPGPYPPMGYRDDVFDGPAGRLEIDGMAPNGTHQLQSFSVLIVCPSPGSQKLSK